jgi:carbon monoxide dehydrogenase subunit G
MAKALARVGPDFIASAGYRKVQQLTVALPIDVVFAALSGDPAGWGQWFPGFSSSGRYLPQASPEADVQREMVMRGLALTENVIVSEEPTRWAFCVTQATMPGVRAFAEDYVLATAGDGTSVTWTIALDLAPWARPLGPVMGSVGASAVRKAFVNLERQPVSGS